MGKIELDHTGAGSGITLSSDGTDLLLNGTAVGGAALELYAENPSSPTAPSATGTNAVAIGSDAVASNTNAFAVGNFTDATGLSSLAIGQGAQATANYNLAIGLNAVSSGERAVAIGNNSVTASASWSTAIGNNSGFGGSQAVTGSGAMALGGSRASGTDSFAAAIANNTASYGATGANSISIGQFTKATTSGAAAFGGAFANASGSQSLAIGRNVLAQQQGSVALGQQSLSAIAGKFAYSSTNFTATGDSQHGMCVLRQSTTDATPKVMLTDNPALSASTTNQIILPNNSAYAFHGTIVARQQASAGTACAAWKIEGLIRREGSAGTTVLVNSATTVLDNTPAWGMALTADVTNGGLAITVTGAAATNIRWVATINTSEVTY